VCYAAGSGLSTELESGKTPLELVLDHEFAWMER
jgi:hypothetical protein